MRPGEAICIWRFVPAILITSYPDFKLSDLPKEAPEEFISEGMSEGCVPLYPHSHTGPVSYVNIHIDILRTARHLAETPFLAIVTSSTHLKRIGWG